MVKKYFMRYENFNCVMILRTLFSNKWKSKPLLLLIELISKIQKMESVEYINQKNILKIGKGGDQLKTKFKWTHIQIE